MKALIQGAFSPSTLVTYKRAFHIFEQFHVTYFSSQPILPANNAIMSNFIAYLYCKNYAPATIVTYVSGLAAMHRLLSWPDPTQSFLVKKLLTGAQKAIGSNDSRLPVTKPILQKLLASLKHSNLDRFTKALLGAMFTLAFHALLRIGEIAVRSTASDPNHVLQFSNLKVFTNRLKNPKALEITLENWKHKNLAPNFHIWIRAASKGGKICPVHHMVKYLALRGKKSGPLFCLSNGSPCTRSHFSKLLQQCLQKTNLSTKFIKGHSFRIGGATTAAALGTSEEYIQRLGRWKSSAYKKYIRLNSFSSKC